jgi:hypothetical protein
VGFVTRLQSGIGTRGDQDHGVVNSGDDERNPPETGIMERELRRVKNARLLLIPASEKTLRTSHNRICQILEAASAGVAVDGAAASNVASLLLYTVDAL